jgi:hypothetical protein
MSMVLTTVISHRFSVPTGKFQDTVTVKEAATGWMVKGLNSGEDIFHDCPQRLCGPYGLLCNEYRDFTGGKPAGA